MKNVVAAVVSGGLMLGASAALADDQTNQKCGCWYIGGGVGYSSSKIDDVAPITGITFTQSKDESDTGWKVFGGYQWNPNFAVELGWVDLGEASQTISFMAPAIGSVTGTFKSSGAFLDVLGIIPVGNNFSLHGKVGAYYAENSLDFSASGPIAPFLPTIGSVVGVPVSEDKDELKWKAGLGARYDFTKQIGLRAEWERYFGLDTDHSNGSGDIDLFSLNLIFSF